MTSSSSSFISHYFLLLVILPPCLSFWPREYPRISLSRWLELEHEERQSYSGVWRTDFENMTKDYMTIQDQGRIYIVSSQIVGLGLSCNASYPIKWISQTRDNEDYSSLYTRVRYFRTNPDVFNERTNTFTATLDLYGEHSGISGNYSCVSVEYADDIGKSIYVYWQGTNPSNLILGGKSIEVQSSDSGGHYAILPCRVSRPDIQVNLYKEVNSEWSLVKSPYVRFNPKFGFRINLYQYNGPYGRWKCAVGDDEDEALIVTVKKGIKDMNLDFNNTFDGNATLFFNRTSQEVVCCSNSGKPPKLHTLFCLDTFSCEMRKEQLHSVVNNGKRNSAKGCTTEHLYTKDSGLLRCLGDGVDVVRYFYTDLPARERNYSANLYFNWAEIPPQHMVQFSPSIKGVMYEGQNVTFSCDTAFNYFADGMQWAIRWKNQSLKFFPLPEQKISSSGGYSSFETISLQSMRLKVTRDVIEVLCFVPIWNDTAWVNKTLTLDVREAQPPKFTNPEPESVTWKLNATEQMLQCDVHGMPFPILKWKKNNKTIFHENNLTFKRINGSISLVVHRVSHDSQGRYSCIANNVGGVSEKLFTVYVEGSSSSGIGTGGIIILVLLVLTLLSALLFLAWKMQLQKKVIDHLSGIVFRDMSTTNPPNPPNTNGGGSVAITGVINPSSDIPRGNSEINPFPSSVS